MTPAIAFLEASLVRPLGLVLLAWLILRVFRVRHPASRHAVWTAVLIGMLLLPIVSVVTPHWTLPVLPAEQTGEMTTADPQSSTTLPVARPAEVQSPGPVNPTPASTAAFEWPSTATVIVGTYLVGLCAMLTYRLIGWALLRRVLSRSRSLRLMCLRESADVVTPVAVGVLRPAVILPAGWRAWNAHTRRAVLAHEFAHLRRRDTLVAALARLVRCVFWFHPVAWWVSRQTSDLAELACDAVALQRVGDPAGYSRVLVEFAEAVNRSGQRVALPGLAIASGSRMSERIDQVFEMSAGTMRKLVRPRVWLAAIGLPALCVTATVVLGARAPQPGGTSPLGEVSTGTAAGSQSVPPSQASAAQNPVAASPSPKFDVVSIKPCLNVESAQTGRGAGPNLAQTSPGHVYWACVTLASLVDQAYAGWDFPLLNMPDRPLAFESRRQDDEPRRVRGGPSWMDSDRFAIEATASVDVINPPPGAVNLMRLPAPMNRALREMLADRFQLKVHRATEQRPMYALTAAAGGLKIKSPAADDCTVFVPGMKRSPPIGAKPYCGSISETMPIAKRERLGAGVDPATVLAMPGPNRRIAYAGVTLQAVAGHLSEVMDRFVMDKTGVTGEFMFAFEYTANENAPAGSGLSIQISGEQIQRVPAQGGAAAAAGRDQTIFQALAALGLKLEPTRGPAEHIVVDHAVRPSPNAPEADALPARAAGAGRPRR